MTTLTLNLDDGRELVFTAPAVIDRQSVEVFLCEQVPILMTESVDPYQARRVLSVVLERGLSEPDFLNACDAHLEHEDVANGHDPWDGPLASGESRRAFLDSLSLRFTGAVFQIAAEFPAPAQPLRAVA